MSLLSFTKLCSLLNDSLQVYTKMSTHSTSKLEISSRIIISSYLHYIVGGTYLDICLTADISVNSFYCILHKCTKAFNNCNQFAFHLSGTEEVLLLANAGFNTISTNNAIEGCVGSIDGYLLKIKLPTSSVVENVKSYFSGHYQTYGIIIQAICDHICRFTKVVILQRLPW
jgi:hypothetical protein